MNLLNCQYTIKVQKTLTNQIPIKMKSYKKHQFYLVSIMLFFIDFICFAFFEKQVIHSLLCWYALTVFRHYNLKKLSIVALLLSLESYTQYDTFGLILIYLTPLTLLALWIKKILYPTIAQPYIFLTLSLCLQHLLVELYMLSLNTPHTWTFSKIIANIIVMIIVSLK